MAKFLVITTEGEDKVKDKVLSLYEDNYMPKNADNIFFVRTNDISDEVAHKLGIKGDEKPNGVAGAVFKLNGAYAGYTSRAIWEWLAKDG